MINIKDIKNKENWEELGVISLQALKKIVDDYVFNYKVNNINPNNVPVFIERNYGEQYLLDSLSLSFGKNLSVILKMNPNEIDFFEGKDERPEDGEYWASRGPSNWDCSGFVVSKEAGERLLALVKKVLNKDECKSWLDWRKYEPNWIQFKFSIEEFDLEKLDRLSIEANGVLTYEILQECKI